MRKISVKYARDGKRVISLVIMKKYLGLILILIFLNIISAETTITDELINTTGNVTASYFSGDGSLLTEIGSSNSTTWWSSVSSWLGGWFVNNAGTLEFNETKLNDAIDARDSDTTYSHLSNFTDDLGNRNYTNNLNFTNGANYWNDTYSTFNETYADTVYSSICGCSYVS